MGACQSACGPLCQQRFPHVPPETVPELDLVALLDHYQLGDILGEGAFGVVSACRNIRTGNEFAVKMVDKVETPLKEIKDEAELLQRLNHANIVKCFGVFYDKCFVCIVMSKFDGGDVVGALEERSKLRTCFADYDLVHVKRQMVLALEYLHGQDVVHRDIKGDNFLMDRPALTDPQCHIALADFGSARMLHSGDRLTEPSGTRSFWSPEIYNRSYSNKVDIWALGVLCFGLLTGKFPFKGEADVRVKEAALPYYVNAECENFVQSMLQRDEAVRFSAAQLLCHPWLDGTTKRSTTMVGLNTSEGEALESDAFTERVDHGIKRRRLSLLARMEEEHVQKSLSREQGQWQRFQDSKEKSQILRNHYNHEFAVKDRRGVRRFYKWLPRSEMRKHQSFHRLQGGTSSEKEAFQLPDLDLPLLAKFLEEHNVKTACFGVGGAKSLEALAQEVQSDSSRLMLDAADYKKIVRVVDVVLLKLFDDHERLLIDAEELYADGRRRSTWRLPGSKKETYENVTQTARRILEETLNLDPSIVVLDEDVVLEEEEQNSPSYPGLYTVYRKEVIHGHVFSQDAELRNRFGLDSRGWSAKERNCTRTLRWITEEEAEASHMKLEVGSSSKVSSLVLAPIGLKEDELKHYLIDLKIDVSQYGQNGAKTLKEFSEELIKGDVRIVKDKNGAGYVVSEVVNLCMQKSDGEILFQVKQEGPGKYINDKVLVPCAKLRPDENTFLVAKRIIRKQFLIDPNQVYLDTDVTLSQEERSTTAYPGLRFVEREHVITANADESGQFRERQGRD